MSKVVFRRRILNLMLNILILLLFSLVFFNYYYYSNDKYFVAETIVRLFKKTLFS